MGVVTDRTGDRKAVANHLAKPPVLTRATQRILCGLCLCAVIYGTLGPLAGYRGRWLHRPTTWQWLPPRVAGHTEDIWTNALLYIPVGLAVRLLIRRRGQRGRTDMWIAWIAATGLSYVTELLQQFMPARASSLVDVAANSAGAFIGSAWAVVFQHWLRRAHRWLFWYLHERRRTWSVATWLAVLTVALLMTVPWEFQRPAAVHGFANTRSPGDSFGLSRFALFAGVGFLWAGQSLARGRKRHAAAFRAVLAVALLAITLELAQTVLAGHVASAVHAAVAMGGGATGALFAAASLTPTNRPTPHMPQGAFLAWGATGNGLPNALVVSPRAARWLTALFAGLAGLILATKLAPLLYGSTWRDHPLVEWPPFRAHFRLPAARALADIFEQVTLYGALTAGCLALAGLPGRTAAFLLVASLAALVQLVQAYRVGHAADSAAPLLALWAWWATVRIWRALVPLAHRERPAPQADDARPISPET